MKNIAGLFAFIMLVLLPLTLAPSCQAQPAPTAPAPAPAPTPAPPPPSPPPAPPPTPQFRVSSLAITPKETVPGESVTVTASVENIGKTKGTYHAALTVNGKVAETMDVALDAGAKQDISFKITEEVPGICNIKLDDLTDTLKILKPAKFTVTSLDISPSPANVGEDVTVTMNLRNVGEAKGTHSLSLVMEGEAIATKDIALDGGVMEEVQFTVSVDSPGTHSIEVDGLKGIVKVVDLVRLPTGTYIAGIEQELTRSYLRVKNELDLDTVIVLTTTEKPDISVRAVYIQSNSEYRINDYGTKPLNVYWTCGKNWDNHSKEFTTDAVFIRFKEPLKFTQSAFRMSVTTDAHRYADLEYCSKDEFPKLN